MSHRSLGQLAQLVLEVGDGSFEFSKPFLGRAGIGLVHGKKRYGRLWVRQVELTAPQKLPTAHPRILWISSQALPMFVSQE
ncbi:MAG: hypothetical protein AMS18_16485 [Gemmatimonas sp. SG8_17]|nr:MAG: hypothetical protein AMS18_16485 [Gemmatimonas sp. SG8_17]